MAYFPFFMDLRGQKGLIAGGGRVALKRVQSLLPYGPSLTVCAPDIVPEIADVPEIALLYQSFVPELLDGMDFVVAATNHRQLNESISKLCKERHILVNVADDQRLCTFIFPALVKRGEMTIGISTGGYSPTAAIYWKKMIESQLPQTFGCQLDYLSGLRARLKEAVPDESRRIVLFSQLLSACLANDGPLTPEIEEKILQQER